MHQRGAAAAMWFVLSGSLLLAGPAETPVLISADRACSVKVDGEDVAILSDDTPKKLLLTPGEHLFSAVAIDKATWKEVVTVGADQKVVSISFGKPAAATTPPAWPFDLNKVLHPEVMARTGINEIAREHSLWVVKQVEAGSPADQSGIKKGFALLKADGVSLSEKSYDEMLALDKGDADSRVTLEGLDKKGLPFNVVITRKVIAADIAPPVTPVFPGTGADTGTGTCTGVATACSMRNAVSCHQGSGCFMLLGKCSGSATACYSLLKFTCGQQPGCFYLGN